MAPPLCSVKSRKIRDWSRSLPPPLNSSPYSASRARPRPPPSTGAGVLPPHRQLVGRGAGGHHLRLPVGAGQPLEVDVPQPGHVATVGDAVVDGDQVGTRVAELVRGTQHLVEARRV